MKPNQINELYDIWEEDPSADNLNILLALVRRRIITRYCVIEPGIHEDIAQKSILFIWRALPGYKGYDAVASYSRNRGTFASFCAMIARRERFNMIANERLTATKDDVLIPLISDIEGQKKGY